MHALTSAIALSVRRAESAICAISQAGGARRPLTDCDSYPWLACGR
jgi:hypothetical protein